MTIDYSNVDLLALESASFIDIMANDIEPALEGQWAEYERNRNGKDESYYARVGNWENSDSKSGSDSVGSKFLYHLKRVFFSVITAIVKAFQWIINVCRNIIQVILIPLNALIKVTSGASKMITLLTKEEKTVYDRLMKEADQKCQRRIRDLLNNEEKFIDKAFDLCDDVSKLTKIALAGGDNYSMKDSERKTYNSVDGLTEKLAAESDSRAAKVNAEVAQIIEARSEIMKECKANISNETAIDAILAATIGQPSDHSKLQEKVREMNDKAKVHEASCTKIMERTKNGFSGISKDLSDVAKLYLNMSKVTVQFVKNFKSICDGESVKMIKRD